MLAEAYLAYERALAGLPFGRSMPYHWGNLPGPISALWLPYDQMFGEFSTAIANGINTLTEYVRRLKAWQMVLDGRADDEKFAITYAFIDPLATVALTLPYAIQNRFLFAAAHLCHQANQIHDPIGWKDDLRQDKDINQLDAAKYGKLWRRYTKFSVRLQRVDSQEYRDETHDFRNAYTHRFPPRIVVGVTGVIQRVLVTKQGAVEYRIGGTEPLSLELIGAALTKQCAESYRAFDKFQELIREHEAAITAYESRQPLQPPGTINPS